MSNTTNNNLIAKNFTNDHHMTFGGAENFADGTAPQIIEGDEHCVICDANGVTVLYGWDMDEEIFHFDSPEFSVAAEAVDFAKLVFQMPKQVVRSLRIQNI